MNYKYIHLLYVPTMACNMGCKYCYLEDNTVDEKCKYGYVDTLDYAIKKFKESNVIPFNISLPSTLAWRLVIFSTDIAITSVSWTILHKQNSISK